MKAALNAVPLVSLWHPAVAEADVVGMEIEVEPSYHYSIIFCCRVADGQSDKMAVNIQVCVKEKCVTEFLPVEKAHVGIPRYLLNFYGGQTV